ncbi:MAG TPA: hypothetical protein DCP91_11470 [Eggerthellaceae bacterium]|nr:hypothetical protein [Eggerthellaceae bacterium]
MNSITIRFAVRTASVIAFLVLVTCLYPMSAFAIADSQLSATEMRTVGSGRTELNAELATQASKSNCLIKTKDYRFKIPKFWRGKVQWKSSSWRTEVYLKGHRGDSRYLLTSVMSGQFTGHGDAFDVVLQKKWKNQSGAYPVPFTVTVLSKNVPYFIWAGWYDSYDDLWIPVKDQKKMLKLATFGKVTYAKAKRNADYKSAVYKTVKRQQRKQFKPSLMVLK